MTLAGKRMGIQQRVQFSNGSNKQSSKGSSPLTIINDIESHEASTCVPQGHLL